MNNDFDYLSKPVNTIGYSKSPNAYIKPVVLVYIPPVTTVPSYTPPVFVPPVYVPPVTIPPVTVYKPIVPLPKPVKLLLYDPYIRPSDRIKLGNVKEWVAIDNPTIATCRKCGHRGLVDDPVIGVY